MNNLERLIETCTELGATAALKALGLTAGEKSQRQCRDTYGKWFADAVRDGRLRPCRIEEGRAGTKYYDITEILRLKAADAARAEIIFKQ